MERLGILFPQPEEDVLRGSGLVALAGGSAGDRRCLQVGYRNPRGPCGGTSNLSNGLELDVVP